MSDMQSESIRQVRDHLADVVDRADREDEPTVITRRGKEVAAVVPIEMLRHCKRLEEQEILALVEERMSSKAPGVPMEDVMAEVLTEDG
ncbi:type II toxin-antitoxin system Phd/YefM family antitoxin [Nocardiopsis kunsanensis]|nr:type II toxin-antitoxin system Phd/YefM family antitoxin [Nocardiopsis kunsanensis]